MKRSFRLGFALSRVPACAIRWRLILPLVLACGLAAAPSIARADDAADAPAPRTAITIGGASVVLVATANELYAFVDQVETNAPVADAELTVTTAEGTSIALRKAPLTMRRTTAGMFVGPLDRAGQTQGAFTVSLRSSAGSGEAAAAMTYDDLTQAAVAASGPGVEFGIAAASAGIGAVAAMLVMFGWRGARKRRTVRPGAGEVTPLPDPRAG